jgi:DNA-binding HxlR family transcriptional regulator
MRVPSGGTVLALLAIPRNGATLRQLSSGPKSLAEMQGDGQVTPKTTQRKCLKGLEGEGLLSRRGRHDSPGVVEHALTDAGVDLLVVVAALEDWLGRKPKGALLIDAAAGQSAVKSLSDSWSTTVLQTMARGPISLGGLAGEIRGVNYPSVERRLSAMRITGQVEATPGDGPGTSYALTEWMQRSVVPLAAAVRWEHLHAPETTASMDRLGIDTAFLLALPLLQIERALDGACRMDVEMDGAEAPAGASAVVVRGRVASSGLVQSGPNDAWAVGPRSAWAAAMTASAKELKVGGDRPLARGLLAGLRLLLSGPVPSAPSA